MFFYIIPLQHFDLLNESKCCRNPIHGHSNCQALVLFPFLKKITKNILNSTHPQVTFCSLSVLQQVRCWSISVPSKVTAVEGSCVVVPCLTQPHTRVIWYQYHKRHYPVVYDGLHPQKVEVQFRGRTSLLGKASEGNCSLKIDNLRSADNNLQVYVSINPGSTGTKYFFDQTVTISVGKERFGN